MVRQIMPLVLIGLCACQGPWGGIDKLSDQSVSATDGAVEAVAGAEGIDRVSSAEDLAAQAAVEQIASEERPGFMGLLKRLSPAKSSETEAAEIALAGLIAEDAPIIADTPEEEVIETAMVERDPQQTSQTSRQMPGLFGLLNRGGQADDPAPQPAALPADPTPEPAQPAPQPVPEPPRRVVTKGPEKDVVPGTVMAFGNIGRVCDLPRGNMGSRVAQYPERGAKYHIYDLAPDGMNSRTFYITGFNDNCARQITGAMVMFGDVEMHEALRYGTAGSIHPGNDTDKAYDRVKARVCKVGRNKPCGSQIKTLQRDTVFLSVYETFGSGGRWSNILLHDGQVEAAAMGAKPK